MKNDTTKKATTAAPKQKTLMEKSKDLLRICRFRYEEEVEADRIFFTIDGEVVGTEGNLVIFSGLPKAGKSTFLSALLATIYLLAEIFGMRLHIKEDERIGVFDTEQSKYSFKKQVSRICKFAGIKKVPTIDFFLVKELEAVEIVHAVETYLECTPKCKILVIDGLVDMLDNFNDEGQSKRVIKLLKKWGKKYGCLIIGVLHVGKKDGFSLGHLGSMVDRYCQSNLKVEKEKDGTITLKEQMLRESGGFEAKNIAYLKETNSFYQTNKIVTDEPTTKSAKLYINDAKTKRVS